MPALIALLIFAGVAVAVGWMAVPVPQPVPLRIPKPAFVLRRMSAPHVRWSGGWRIVLEGLAFLGAVLPISQLRRERLQERLAYVRSRLTVEAFLGLKLVGMVGSLAAVIIVLVELKRIEAPWLVLAAAVGFFLPEFWLGRRHAKRQKAILRLLPEVIDLLMLCIGAGLDFLGALNKVVAIKQFRKQPLAEELSVVLQEIKLGKRRSESLRAMAKRVNLLEVSSFVRTTVQAEKMGTPIGEVLGIHAEDVRFQRFQRAERAAMKAPIKILFPLIFFIMPCVALIVGAPVFLQFMRQNPFAR